jgi:Autotransporter beta-domain
LRFVIAARRYSARVTAVITCAFMIVHNTQAEEPNSIEFGLSLMSFRYAEFPDDKRLNNKETGILPGLNVGLKFAPGAWRIGFFGSVHSGDVDYDGATSAFRPHKTQTETTIFNGLASVGYAFSISDSFALTPYLGAGYRYWRRDIQPNNGVAGLQEDYRWFYGALGLEALWQKSERFLIGADVRVIRPVNAKLDVKIVPETTLDLGSRTGYRIGMPLQWRFNRRFGISMEPYYEHQELGASAPKNRVLEPSSDSDNFGLQVSGRLLF